MKIINPVFKQNYHGYLNQLSLADAVMRSSSLGISVVNDGQAVQIPFFNHIYRVSKSGIVDPQGKRPDYSTCVILLKYLLMNPQSMSENKEWIPFREFSDAGHGQNAGLSNYTIQKISEFYSGRLNGLTKAAARLGGKVPDILYPYDLCAVIPALPQIPILFLFNDADAHLPAQAFILYERRASCFLDAECRVMVDGSLFKHLKMAEKA